MDAQTYVMNLLAQCGIQLSVHLVGSALSGARHALSDVDVAILLNPHPDMDFVRFPNFLNVTF